MLQTTLLGTDVKRLRDRLIDFINFINFKTLSIKIVLTPLKIADMFKVKDPIPKSLAIYRFVCPGCNVCYIGETTRHLSTRVKEHLKTD